MAEAPQLTINLNRKNALYASARRQLRRVSNELERFKQENERLKLANAQLLERVAGKTPAQAAGELRAFYGKRFRQVQPWEVVTGQMYLIALSKYGTSRPEARWQIGTGYSNDQMCVVRLPNGNPLIVYPNDSPHTGEIWELIDLYATRPEYAPADGKRFYFAEDFRMLTRVDDRDVRVNVPRGTVATLRKKTDPYGDHWEVLTEETGDTPVVVFDVDEAGEVPAYFALLEDTPEAINNIGNR